jgi:hypothetical protein
MGIGRDSDVRGGRPQTVRPAGRIEEGVLSGPGDTDDRRSGADHTGSVEEVQ